MKRKWETVHTINEYYDGPRSGSTELNCEPYWYRSVCLDGEWDQNEDRFELTFVPQEFLVLDLEQQAIFCRWDEARKNGHIAWLDGDVDSFGALPDEMQRFREIKARMDALLNYARPSFLARGLFSPDAKQVNWEILEDKR